MTSETSEKAFLTELSLILALALLLTASFAVAYTPTVSFTDSGASTSSYEKFHVISTSYDFTLTTASPIKGGNIHVGGASHFVNFTHDALTLATNANQNFSLGAETNSMTMKLNAIATDHVEVITTDTKTEKLSFGYIMPSTLSFNVPQTVLYTQGGTTQVIQQSSYFTSASSFASCAAPCVFQNTANRTLIVSAPSTSGGYTLDFYFPVYTTGGPPVVTTTATGGGCCAAPPVLPPPIPSGNSTSTASTGGTVQIAVVIAIVVVIVALVLGRASESNPFRAPRSGSAKPRKPSSGKPDWGR